MITTELTNFSSVVEAPYPYFGRGKRTGNVVLFTGVNTGTAVHIEEISAYPMGYYSETWTEEEFTRITKGEIKITIS